MFVYFYYVLVGYVEMFGYVFVDGEFGGVVIGDLVVVLQQGQFGEVQMVGQGNYFLFDVFLQIVIVDEGVGVVIDDVIVEVCIQVSFGYGYVEGIGDVLVEWIGGYFDVELWIVFWMVGIV